jgi:chemotaxis protein methyltransferase CheR
MSAVSTRISMSPDQFEKMSKIIYDRSGIHFPENKKYVIESRLSHRLTELELEDFDQYIAYLTMGPYQMDEFQEMFNRITINETSFFRNEAQLDVFEKVILPQLLEQRSSTKRLRIWSAACSSGEEPFTLAMLIHRSLGVRLSDWHIEILGTDISEKTLSVAQSGIYSNYAIRTTPKLMLDRYFKEDGRNFVLSDEIRSMVSFEKHNLKDSMAAKRHGTWDVIFCRNVLIYFDDPMKKGVISMFDNQLAKDGTLFIGHSERIASLTDRFTQLDIPQGFCYQKCEYVESEAGS